MTVKNIYIVTGANRGIGKAVVKALLSQPDAHIYATARNLESGHAALNEMGNPVNASACHLDVLDLVSIQSLADHIKNEYGERCVTGLINNAGRSDTGKNGFEPMEEMVHVNYTGVRNVLNVFVPMMKEGGKIVNVASRSGLYNYIPEGSTARKTIENPTRLEDIDDFVQQELATAKRNLESYGSAFPSIVPRVTTIYGMSKIGVLALTQYYARNLKNVPCSALCPGAVDTDMLATAELASPGNRALLEKLGFKVKQPDEAAKFIIWQTTVNENDTETNGKFFADGQEISFYDGSTV